jgi:hypothetical protein
MKGDPDAMEFWLSCGHKQRPRTPRTAKNGSLLDWCVRCIAFRVVAKVVPTRQAYRERAPDLFARRLP